MLALDQVAVTYPDGTQALQPLSLRLEEGAFNVLLGPSGAGKSTLLRALNGLVTPTGGQVTELDGTPIGVSSGVARGLRAHRRRTGMIFQSHQLIGRLSAMRNAMTGRLAHCGTWRSLLPMPAEDQAVALAALERVGLIDKALVRTQNLSGGEQQRVGVARAMAQQPSLVLADEPVASLDPATSRQVLRLIHDICKQDGITAVVSLHQVELCKEFADRVVGIAKGRKVFDGSVGELSEGDIEAIYGRPGVGATQRAA
jgi:phosphonate transport system ATP-binding protein